MLRDIIIAYYLGTSIFASAFFVAFTLPNLFRRLFGEGALSAAFIPIFIETRTKQGDKAAWDMASKVVTMVAALLSAIALVGVLLFSVLAKLPCFSESTTIMFELSRIMFPYVVFICLAALFMAVLNSFKHFATSAFTPCLLNIILIVVMLVIFPMLGNEPSVWARALAWGVVAAGVAQVVFQIPALKRFGCPFKFSNRWNDPKIRQMLVLMAPAALGMAVTQFNVLIDRLLALLIGGWAPAALFYSERMIYFPLGIIATAMGTVLLPTFSSQRAEADHAAMSTTINHSLRLLSFIMVPAALGLLVLAPNILSCIFEWGGQFSDESTLLSARALMFYAPGLVVFSAAKVLVPAFYSMKDTKTPVRIGIYIVLVNLTLNIIFILTLPEYWKHAGMAFSTVLAEAAGMSALAVILTRRVKHIMWKPIFFSSIRHILGAAIMAFTAWFLAHQTLPMFGSLMMAKLANICALIVSIGGAVMVYLILAILFRMPELREIKSALLRR